MHSHRRPATPAQAAALGSAVRLRILRLCYQRPLTNKEIAGALGRDPATTLHHVRRLVDADLLAALQPRRGRRGAREIPYRATGLSWWLDPAADPTAVEEAMLEAFLGEVADVGVDALHQTRLVVQLDPTGVAELRERLAALFEEFVARPVDPSGQRQAVYLALYPGE